MSGWLRAPRGVDDLLAQAGHPVVAGQGGHQHLARGGHGVQQIRPLVQVHAVLDRVDAVPDRRRAAVQALGVRGDAVAQPVRLVGDGGQFGVGELERIGILELVGPGAGGHHLDEVRAPPDLLPDRAPHVVFAVGLAVHVTVEAPARGGRGDDLAAGQQARAAERAVAHGLPGLLRQQALGAGHADGGHPEAQVVTQLGLQEVGVNAGERFLGALGGVRDGSRGVRVGVGQARHEDPLAQIQRAGTVRARLGGVGHPADHPVFDQDRRVLAQRRPGAVPQPCSGQPEPSLIRGGRRDQRREPVRHVPAAFLPCLPLCLLLWVLLWVRHDLLMGRSGHRLMVFAWCAYRFPVRFFLASRTGV